jgi:hypothetical protein
MEPLSFRMLLAELSPHVQSTYLTGVFRHPVSVVVGQRAQLR